MSEDIAKMKEQLLKRKSPLFRRSSLSSILKTQRKESLEKDLPIRKAHSLPSKKESLSDNIARFVYLHNNFKELDYRQLIEVIFLQTELGIIDDLFREDKMDFNDIIYLKQFVRERAKNVKELRSSDISTTPMIDIDLPSKEQQAILQFKSPLATILSEFKKTPPLTAKGMAKMISKYLVEAQANPSEIGANIIYSDKSGNKQIFALSKRPYPYFQHAKEYELYSTINKLEVKNYEDKKLWRKYKQLIIEIIEDFVSIIQNLDRSAKAIFSAPLLVRYGLIEKKVSLRSGLENLLVRRLQQTLSTEPIRPLLVRTTRKRSRMSS